jgi:C-terminal processing protease CtpA/Prc
LKYTIGKRYLPDDTNIDHIGIKPDVALGFDKDLYDKEARD